MDLPTYTNIWRIEKRLYKLYDLRLPMPLPLVQIGVFLGVFVPWIVFLQLVGVPFGGGWNLPLYLVPPSILTWLATRPVIEGKRLGELLLSQTRYLTEPRTWCRLTPIREPDEVVVVVRVWRHRESTAEVGLAVRSSRKVGRARKRGRHGEARPAAAIPAMIQAGARSGTIHGGAKSGVPAARRAAARVWSAAGQQMSAAATEGEPAVRDAAQSRDAVQSRDARQATFAPPSFGEQAAGAAETARSARPAGDRGGPILPLRSERPWRPWPPQRAQEQATGPATRSPTEPARGSAPEPAGRRPSGPRNLSHEPDAPAGAGPPSAAEITFLPSQQPGPGPAGGRGARSPGESRGTQKPGDVPAAHGGQQVRGQGDTPTGRRPRGRWPGSVPLRPPPAGPGDPASPTAPVVPFMTTGSHPPGDGPKDGKDGPPESAPGPGRHRREPRTDALVWPVSPHQRPAKPRTAGPAGGPAASTPLEPPRKPAAAKDAAPPRPAGGAPAGGVRAGRAPGATSDGSSSSASSSASSSPSPAADGRGVASTPSAEASDAAVSNLADATKRRPAAGRHRAGEPDDSRSRARPHDEAPESPARAFRSGPASPIRPGPPSPPPAPLETRDGARSAHRRRRLFQGNGHGDGDYAERVRTAFQGSRHIVVLGCTGGAGQTVTTLMLGHIFAQQREDRIVGVDVNPGPGALARRTRNETPETLTSLLAHAERVIGYPTMRRYTSQARSGLEVVNAGKNPVQALDDRDYALVMGTLDQFYSVVLLDAAAAVVARVLPYADQIVLVAPASVDAPRAVAMTFEWLDGHGYGELRTRAVMVINGVSRRSMDDVEQAESVARGRCRALVRIPWDDHLGAGRSPRNELRQLRTPTRRAYLALGGVVASGFAQVPDRYRQPEASR